MTNKVEDYKSKMLSFLKRSFPEKDEYELEKKLDKIIKERNKQDENISYDIRFMDQISTDVNDVALDKLETFLNKKGHILNKYGTAYAQHEEHEALESKMLEYTGNKRKEAKKLKFQHINDEDPTLMNRYDSEQQTYKASIMNSYYGVLTANGSIFRDLDCGESVTASGEEIIMTAIDTFEKFLKGNLHFYTSSDIIVYVDNILETEYTTEINTNRKITVEKILDKFSKLFYDPETMIPVENVNLMECESLVNYFNKLSKEDLKKIYYKNNLFEFLTDTKLYKEFEKILNKEIPFLNPNGPNNLPKGHEEDKELKATFDKEWKENEEILKNVWSYVKDWVFYNFIDINKYNFCKFGKRKVVPIVDTDSNFLHLEPAYEYFRENIECVDDSKEMKVASINCITYLITNVINEAYLKFGKLHFIAEKYRPLINMKNEFMLSRLLLTKNKKSYASTVLMQEGNIIEKQKIDLKGLAIKKSNTNKNVAKHFTDLLKNDILLSDEIKYNNILRKYFTLSNNIKQSLKDGNVDYTLPLRANEIGGYKNPLNVMQVRGCMTWNLLFPELEIVYPNNINLIKVIIEPNIELIKSQIDKYIEEKNLEVDENEYNLFLERMDEVINFSYKIDKTTTVENALCKDGIINVVSLPKNLTKIPDLLMPFLNVNKMVLDHLNSGTVLLDALNIQTPNIDKNLIPTNIIKI